MSDPVEDAYKKSQETHAQITPDGIVRPELVSKIKEIRGEVDIQFAQLIANPYLAPDLVDDFRSSLTRLIAVLIENDIPLQHEGRPRTAEDIITESLGELAGMVGAKGIGSLIKMKKSFKDNLQDFMDSDEFEIFQDPETGEYYFIDPYTGEEVDCDEFGNLMEE